MWLTVIDTLRYYVPMNRPITSLSKGKYVCFHMDKNYLKSLLKMIKLLIEIIYGLIVCLHWRRFACCLDLDSSNMPVSTVKNLNYNTYKHKWHALMCIRFYLHIYVCCISRPCIHVCFKYRKISQLQYI